MANYVAPFIGNGVVLKTPTADGSADQVIKTDGSGNLAFVDQSGGGSSGATVQTTNATMASNTIYVANHASNEIELTLPASPTAGDWLRVLGLGAGGWVVKSNASATSQKIDLAGTDSDTSSSDSLRLVESSTTYNSLVLVCTDASSNQVWSAVEHQDGAIAWNPGGRALFAGGLDATTYSNVIDYFDINSIGNATDFGDLTVARYGPAAVCSGVRACFGGGYTGTSSNVIDYVATATTGNATDFGDLTKARYGVAGASNSTRGVFLAGYSSGNDEELDYITIASTGNATDFGDAIVATRWVAGGGSSTRGLYAGGNSGSNTDVIGYITIATTGNATDFGDLTVARMQPTAVYSGTRFVACGGWSGYLDVMDYITIASTGNATDFGDLTVARKAPGGASNDTRGCIGGGTDGSVSNVIDYITIASPGNATDFGDLTVSRENICGTSDNHGGLQ